jgi:hypothetical protein
MKLINFYEEHDGGYVSIKVKTLFIPSEHIYLHKETNTNRLTEEGFNYLKTQWPSLDSEDVDDFHDLYFLDYASDKDKDEKIEDLKAELNNLLYNF